MQQRLSLFATRMSLEDFAAELSQIFQPCAKIFGQLLVDLAAKSLGDGGAFSRSRDGDLQVASADDGAKIKVAVGNVIHTIANDVSFDTAPINSGVDHRRISRGDDKEVAVEVEDFEAALKPFELTFGGELLDFGPGMGGDHSELDPGLEQAAYLFERDVARADEQAAAAV